MNEQEAQFAEQIYAALMRHSAQSGRSQQSANFQLGISDIGFCQERTRRMLTQNRPEDEPDLLAALIGTAVGDYAEQALKAQLWPGAIIQPEVTLTLKLDAMVANIPGHPDIVLPDWGVWDGKTDRGLTEIRRTGPSFQQQFQRHAYALACFEAGMFPDLSLDEVHVGNFWIDRAGDHHEVHVQTELFNPEVIDQGVIWLDEVVWAYLHNEEAMKEPPRQMCSVVCGFYKECRAWETDVSGLIDDPELVGLVWQHVNGKAQEKQGKMAADEARAKLRGIEGSTRDHLVRWIHVNEVEATEDKPGRAAYARLDITPTKRERKS